jgi:hypothetical protein
MGVVSATGVAETSPNQSNPGVRLNYYYLASSAVASATVATVSANLLFCQPVALVGQVNRIGIEVTTGAAGLCRLGVYTNNGTGAPGTLIVDAGTVDTTSNAIVEAVIDLTLRGEWVWLAAVFNATPGVRAGTSAGPSIIGATTVTTATKSIYGAFTYAALPETPPTIATHTVSGPSVFLRRV